MRYQFKVEGMTCGHCAKTVTESIQEIDGAARVDVDLPKGRVTVESSQASERIDALQEKTGRGG